MNHRFPVMTASVPQTEAASAASVVNKQTSTQASSECSSFTDLLSSVLSPEEAVTGFEAAACVDLSALDGLNLDFPLLHHHHNGNTTLATERALCRNEHSVTSTSYTHSSNVSELVAAAIMASSEDSEAGNFPGEYQILKLIMLRNYSALGATRRLLALPDANPLYSTLQDATRRHSRYSTLPGANRCYSAALGATPRATPRHSTLPEDPWDFTIGKMI
jgi:hypothetical protein